jgi:hypothetical protein
MCRTSPAFLVAEKHTPLSKEPVYPVLRSTPGKTCRELNIRDRKKAIIERELPHQPQVFAPPLKYAGHNVP